MVQVRLLDVSGTRYEDIKSDAIDLEGNMVGGVCVGEGCVMDV